MPMGFAEAVACANRNTKTDAADAILTCNYLRATMGTAWNFDFDAWSSVRSTVSNINSGKPRVCDGKRRLGRVILVVCLLDHDGNVLPLAGAARALAPTCRGIE
jgi:hypothetical protein